LAGQNRILKEGQVLFRAGDEPDGMYLIRNGELKVYLEEEGKEVNLAAVGQGGMIGEMGLFDRQPRSASVKANCPTEITHISKDDFNKLMKQIPKWFVGLMSGLSGRLRSTNERLQKLESDGNVKKGSPFVHVRRILHVMVLLWSKDGEKEGREWVLDKNNLLKTLVDLFGEDGEKVEELLKVLKQEVIITERKGQYNNAVLAVPNRAVLSSFAQFLSGFLNKAERPCLSFEALQILDCLAEHVSKSPYEKGSLSIDELIKLGRRNGCKTQTWKACLNQLRSSKCLIV
jgi:hypothetical protein